MEDKLVLDNYIKEQKSKGFSDSEIRDQLSEASWNKTLVEEMLKANADKTESFLEKATEVNQFTQYSQHLTDDENITNSYKIGFYIVLVTNLRVIIIKRFPRNITKIEYDDIELVEYFTDVSWRKLISGLISGLVAAIFFIFDSLITSKIAKSITPLAPILKREFAFGINLISFALIVLLLLVFIINIIAFLDSYQGRLRIIPKRQGPKDITTKMTKDVQEFINFMEIKKKEAKTTQQI